MTTSEIEDELEAVADAPLEGGVTLELTMPEAQFLRHLLSRVDGHAEFSARRLADTIRQALREIGVPYTRGVKCFSKVDYGDDTDLTFGLTRDDWTPAKDAWQKEMAALTSKEETK